MKLEFSRQILEKQLRYLILWISVQWEPSCSMLTGNTKPVVAFRNFANSPTMKVEIDGTDKTKWELWSSCKILVGNPRRKRLLGIRGELSYLAPLGSENISAPYFKQCFFRDGKGITPQTVKHHASQSQDRNKYFILYIEFCINNKI